jgi:hypothetical protein
MNHPSYQKGAYFHILDNPTNFNGWIFWSKNFMVGRTRQDIPPQQISDHSVEPFLRYELMKTFLVKMRILGWFWENLHKTERLNIFKTACAKILRTSPSITCIKLSQIGGPRLSRVYIRSVVPYMEWLIKKKNHCRNMTFDIFLSTFAPLIYFPFDICIFALFTVSICLCFLRHFTFQRLTATPPPQNWRSWSLLAPSQHKTRY